MDDISQVFFWVIATFIVAAMLYLRKKYPNSVLMQELAEPHTSFRLSGHEADIDKILQNEMYYYQTLTAEKKSEFVQRVIFFNSSTVFYPKGDIKITPRHVVLISATFVEITFGLHSSLLNYLNQIKIFPAHYFDPRTKRQYKGEVDVEGMVCLSWEDFEIGLHDSHDGRNLGLHELAHAFAIEIIEKDAHYHDLLLKLKPIFLQARYEINNPDARHNLLREYGYYNLHEYFAVATEVFFENPEYLAESGSPLYEMLCELFQQNPLEQYRLSK